MQSPILQHPTCPHPDAAVVAAAADAIQGCLDRLSPLAGGAKTATVQRGICRLISALEGSGADLRSTIDLWASAPIRAFVAEG